MSDDALSMILAAVLRLEGGQAGLLERTTRIEGKLADIRIDIGVNMARADRAHEASDSTRLEVRLLGEQLDGMSRQIRRLQARLDEREGPPQ